ncbi:MAG: hypothetical protein WC356_03610 [Candidatus Micrarchaeia archaeon]|jgi:hypothetical protein
METYNFIVKHWVEIVAVYTSLVTIASIIVKWTKTLKDDTVLLAIIKFTSKWIALNRTVNDSKERDRITDINEIGTINEKE